MRTYERVIRLLREAVSDPDQLVHAFRELYEFAIVEENEFERLPQQTQDVLLDLVFDLDYFEPDSMARREDSSFFGPARAVQEIRAALDQLTRQGAA